MLIFVQYMINRSYYGGIGDPFSVLIFPVPEPLGGEDEVGHEHGGGCGEPSHLLGPAGHGIKTNGVTLHTAGNKAHIRLCLLQILSVWPVVYYTFLHVG